MSNIGQNELELQQRMHLVQQVLAMRLSIEKQRPVAGTSPPREPHPLEVHIHNEVPGVPGPEKTDADVVVPVVHRTLTQRDRSHSIRLAHLEQGLKSLQGAASEEPGASEFGSPSTSDGVNLYGAGMDSAVTMSRLSPDSYPPPADTHPTLLQDSSMPSSTGVNSWLSPAPDSGGPSSAPCSLSQVASPHNTPERFPLPPSLEETASQTRLRYEGGHPGHDPGTHFGIPPSTEARIESLSEETTPLPKPKAPLVAGVASDTPRGRELVNRLQNIYRFVQAPKEDQPVEDEARPSAESPAQDPGPSVSPAFAEGYLVGMKVGPDSGKDGVRRRPANTKAETPKVADSLTESLKELDEEWHKVEVEEMDGAPTTRDASSPSKWPLTRTTADQ
ncbi:hypothetical protein CYMTET_16378, partial [Cymbomonas tetramitiformis]